MEGDGAKEEKEAQSSIGCRLFMSGHRCGTGGSQPVCKFVESRGFSGGHCLDFGRGVLSGEYDLVFLIILCLFSVLRSKSKKGQI